MHSDFWHERWRQNQIGFHEPAAHRWLDTYWPRLSPRTDEAVFVPLCGKSLDLRWLRAAGHRVHGVELSPIAVAAFFEEAGLVPARTPHGALERWEAEGIRIDCGDFFALGPADLEGCSLVYDRAATIALPPSLRSKYAAHLAALLPPATRMLAITIEFPPSDRDPATDGPPFSVSEAWLAEHYPHPTLLAAEQVPASNSRMQSQGITHITERAHLITFQQ